ncbi:class II aldolase/adducin family protein, partial [Marinovum algicola]|uniref:class II aldolase/adducin family protein n=1 Tax=Marinovum algicola TaxID=42444 RepID=UPI0032EB80F3
MTPESQLREQICLLAKSMFDRGLTGGSTGNISARTEDGGLLVSPTGTSFGRLDPGRLSRFDAAGSHIDGDKPTKEMPLHTAFYDTRSTAGAVVHLHSTHSVALSMLPDAIRAAAAAGFDAVECHWPYDTPPAEVTAALAETGLPMLGLNTRRGNV